MGTDNTRAQMDGSTKHDQVKYLGNFSAVDPVYSRAMYCAKCNVSWTGCWDNFQCPQCGEGELPTNELSEY